MYKNSFNKLLIFVTNECFVKNVVSLKKKNELISNKKMYIYIHTECSKNICISYIVYHIYALYIFIYL